MVEEFINFLAHLPSNLESPLYAELNKPAMLTAQGSPDKVRIYDINSQESNTPYVKLWDKGQRQRMATFLGGSYMEKQTLTCECVALGITALMAVDRAELLKLAVEGLVKKLQGTLSGLTRNDLGGTGSSETVSQIYIGDVGNEDPVQGQNSKFTAKRTAIIEIWVQKVRTR